MSAFITYDSTTGAIRCAYSVSHSDDLTSIIAANTPSGASSLAVEDGHAALTNQSGWIVQKGCLVAIVPTDAALLSAAQTAQLVVLTAAYNSATYANVSYLGTTFMADQDSQQKFAHALTAYNAVGATPSGFFAVDANYDQVPMTLDQLKGLIEAISTQVWAAFQRWVTVKQALAAATTVAAVQAVSW